MSRTQNPAFQVILRGFDILCLCLSGHVDTVNMPACFEQIHLDTVAEYEVYEWFIASTWSLGRRIDTQWCSQS